MIKTLFQRKRLSTASARCVELYPSTDGSVSSFSEIWNGIRVQCRVVHALILREMLTTYGRNDIGYLWALVEPLILLMLFLAAFHYQGRTDHGGMNLVSFLTTGIISYVALRRMAKNVSNAIDSNAGLLLYPQVTPTDTMLARALLNATTIIVVFMIIVLGSWLLGVGAMPHDWLGVIEALLALTLLGLCLGLLQYAVVKLIPPVKYILSPLWRILLFTSCVFFAMKDLPLGMQNVIYYNPIAHCIEMLRHAYFLGFESPIEGYSYILQWSSLSLFIGLLTERVYRYKDVGR